MKENTSVRRLSVSQWYEYVKQGIFLTVQIPLNGISMQPLIRKDKDLVTIVPINRELRIGDVVLFLREDGAYVVHRIASMRAIESGQTLIETWGDYCEHPDKLITEDKILGIAEYMERNRRKYALNEGIFRTYGLIWIKRKRMRFILLKSMKLMERIYLKCFFQKKL